MGHKRNHHPQKLALMHTTSRVFSCLAVSVLSLAFSAPSAFAQSGDTLEKLRKTQQLNIGVREDNMPFASFRQGVASGYSIDICNKLVEQLRKELKLPELRVQYVVVTAANRLGKVRDGEADIECGTTVNTVSRAQEVDFSYAHFIAGTRFMSRKSANLVDHAQLEGQKVGVVKGTTAEKLFSQLKADTVKTMVLVAFPRNQEAMAALEAGQINAVAQLDVLLEGMRSQSKQPGDFIVSSKSLSIEPMALVVRKNDLAFKAVVDKTLSGLLASSEYSALYNKWFRNEVFNMPVPVMLNDCLRRPCRGAATALGLGYQL